MISGDVKFEKDEIGKLTPKMIQIAKKVFLKVGKLTATYLRVERFTGGTSSTRLAVRTGRLRASVQPITPQEKVDGIEGGVQFGTVYARVHVGPRGQETIIRPKTKKFLAIPLPPAMSKAGVPRGSPRQGPWGETFVRRVEEAGEERLIVFGKREITKGPKTGQLRKSIVPLFLLVRSVKVKARIHPEEILDFMEPKIIEEFREEGIKIT